MIQNPKPSNFIQNKIKIIIMEKSVVEVSSFNYSTLKITIHVLIGRENASWF